MTLFPYTTLFRSIFLYLPPNFLITLNIIKLLGCNRNQWTYNCIAGFIDNPCCYVLMAFSRFTINKRSMLLCTNGLFSVYYQQTCAITTMLQSKSPKGTTIIYFLFSEGQKHCFLVAHGASTINSLQKHTYRRLKIT